jgi:hypothetical protein
MKEVQRLVGPELSGQIASIVDSRGGKFRTFFSTNLPDTFSHPIQRLGIQRENAELVRKFFVEVNDGVGRVIKRIRTEIAPLRTDIHNQFRSHPLDKRGLTVERAMADAGASAVNSRAAFSFLLTRLPLPVMARLSEFKDGEQILKASREYLDSLRNSESRKVFDLDMVELPSRQEIDAALYGMTPNQRFYASQAAKSIDSRVNDVIDATRRQFGEASDQYLLERLGKLPVVLFSNRLFETYEQFATTTQDLLFTSQASKMGVSRETIEAAISRAIYPEGTGSKPVSQREALPRLAQELGFRSVEEARGPLELIYHSFASDNPSAVSFDSLRKGAPGIAKGVHARWFMKQAMREGWLPDGVQLWESMVHQLDRIAHIEPAVARAAKILPEAFRGDPTRTRYAINWLSDTLNDNTAIDAFLQFGGTANRIAHGLVQFGYFRTLWGSKNQLMLDLSTVPLLQQGETATISHFRAGLKLLRQHDHPANALLRSVNTA